jgi:hypothetical protein
MSDYETQLQALHKAVVEGDTAAILPLLGDARIDELSSEERLKAYMDGYVERLISATFADYLALAHYFGEFSLKHSIRIYATTTPSKEWDLNLYSIPFAKYFAGVTTDSAAIQLAELESAITEVYWLPESSPLDPSIFAGLSIEQFAGLQFTSRTARKLLKFNYKINDYVTSFRAERPLNDMPHGEQYLCIVRHENEVQRVELEQAEYIMLKLLSEGKTLGQALEIAAENTNPDELQTTLPNYIGKWIGSGVFGF